MTVTLIISVYKDVVSLVTILDALKFQSYKDFEIIVSEDGESSEMKSFLENYTHPNKIKHLTQVDEGWRKNQALNNAIRNSYGEYLIFIDGDCVPHHRFIESHLAFAKEGTIIAGRRIKLGPVYTQMFKDHIKDLLKLENRVMLNFFDVKKDGAKFYEEAIYVNPMTWVGKILKKRKFRTIKGCNMSFFKKDILAINGFDEDYKLPAIGEDIDLIWRFRGLGFQFCSVKNFAVQYHLFHKENWTDNSFNERLMLEKMKKKLYVCVNGLYIDR